MARQRKARADTAMIESKQVLRGLGLLACGLWAAQAHAQEPGDARAGRGVARRICAECHAIQPQQAVSPNPFAPHFEYIAGIDGMTSIALNVALQRSHLTMPNIILTPKETRDVVSYILSLRRN
jgi:mono/diheme cytochrome c family protein